MENYWNLKISLYYAELDFMYEGLSDFFLSPFPPGHKQPFELKIGYFAHSLVKEIEVIQKLLKTVRS